MERATAGCTAWRSNLTIADNQFLNIYVANLELPGEFLVESQEHLLSDIGDCWAGTTLIGVRQNRTYNRIQFLLPFL